MVHSQLHVFTTSVTSLRSSPPGLSHGIQKYEVMVETRFQHTYHVPGLLKETSLSIPVFLRTIQVSHTRSQGKRSYKYLSEKKVLTTFYTIKQKKLYLQCTLQRCESTMTERLYYISKRITDIKYKYRHCRINKEVKTEIVPNKYMTHQ